MRKRNFLLLTVIVFAVVADLAIPQIVNSIAQSRTMHNSVLMPAGEKFYINGSYREIEEAGFESGPLNVYDRVPEATVTGAWTATNLTAVRLLVNFTGNAPPVPEINRTSGSFSVTFNASDISTVQVIFYSNCTDVITLTQPFAVTYRYN